MTVEFRGNFLPPEMLARRYTVSQRVLVDSQRHGKRTGVVTEVRPTMGFPYAVRAEDDGEVLYLLEREIPSDLPASNRWEDVEPWLEET